VFVVQGSWCAANVDGKKKKSDEEAKKKYRKGLTAKSDSCIALISRRLKF
jgi:hypothetical protein